MITTAADQYLTPKDVAKRLQVEPKTVRAWIRRGKLVAFPLPGGRQYRILPGAIDAMLIAEAGRQ